MAERSVRVVVLKSHARETPVTESNFGVETRSLPGLANGEILLQTLELSPDPYMRGRMTGLESYLPKLPLNEPIQGFGVARVVESRHSAYQPGQVLLGVIDWSDYSLWREGKDQTGLSQGIGVDSNRLLPVSPYAVPYARALDVVGMTGITAHLAMMEVAKPQPGETVVISAAAGSVGSIAGQIAKLCGARVIGIAGTEEKCGLLIGRLGFDAALNYKSRTLASDLRDLVPKGADVYVDNVGGALGQMVMSQMSWPARIVQIGQISTYGDKSGWTPEAVHPVHDSRLAPVRFHATMFSDRIPGALTQLGLWLEEGKVIGLDTVYDGIENAPKAFIGLMQGENIGKMRIHLAD